MGKWLSKFLDGSLVSSPDIPDAMDRLSGLSGGEMADSDLTVEPADPTSTVYWESDSTILGPASVSSVAKSRDQFYLCVEWQDSYRWIHESLLRSKKQFEQHVACHCCQGLEFWISVHGVRVCSRCHPPAHPSLIRA